ncbi:MAG: hypothetical protein H7Y17_05675 [Chlorobia bacterium]|nr:hypothetical protein [Fimbriimonadaceae bacterium]
MTSRLVNVHQLTVAFMVSMNSWTPTQTFHGIQEPSGRPRTAANPVAKNLLVLSDFALLSLEGARRSSKLRTEAEHLLPGRSVTDFVPRIV